MCFFDCKCKSLNRLGENIKRKKSELFCLIKEKKKKLKKEKTKTKTRNRKASRKTEMQEGSQGRPAGRLTSNV